MQNSDLATVKGNASPFIRTKTDNQRGKGSQAREQEHEQEGKIMQQRVHL